MILVLGQARSLRVPNLGCRWAESPGRFDVCQKLCMSQDAWVITLWWWSCLSPVAHCCSLLNHLNSLHGGMFKFNAKFDAHSLLYSLIHFEWNCCTVHRLTQRRLQLLLTNTVKWSLFTQVHPVHSPWLPGYINVAPTILILTMSGLFLDRPHIYFDFFGCIEVEYFPIFIY